MVHAATSVESADRPKRVFAAGGAVTRNDEYATTQPVCVAARQSGMCANVPPASRPRGTRMPSGPPMSNAETMRDCIGVPSISRRINSVRMLAALRMPDQHNPTIAIVVREVVAPRGANVLVSDAQEVGRLIAGGVSTTHGGERELPVHGREQSTLRAKPRQLQSHDVSLGGVGYEITERRRIRRHRGIDVEAIHRRLGIQPRALNG